MLSFFTCVASFQITGVASAISPLRAIVADVGALATARLSNMLMGAVPSDSSNICAAARQGGVLFAYRATCQLTSDGVGYGFSASYGVQWPGLGGMVVHVHAP